MARINNTTTFPITTPATDDLVIGTDVSNTTNSANGETVNFTVGSLSQFLQNSAAWHPYNKTTVDDSNDGLFWDHSVDGDTATEVTPDFADGYEYAIVFENVAGTAANDNLQIELYRESSASYLSAESITTAAMNPTGGTSYGILRISMPRVVAQVYRLNWIVPFGQRRGGGEDNIASDEDVLNTSSPDKSLRARLSINGGTSLGQGKMYLLRRREFLSG